jgi:hypothetical protein
MSLNKDPAIVQADIDKEMQHLKSIPVEGRDFVCNTLYHVVFDCDFGLFYNPENRKEYNDVNFEGLSGTKIDGISVTYDKNYAIDIAKKSVDAAVKKGSFGSGYNKKYPFLGAVIVGFEFIDCKAVKFAQKIENSVGENDLIFHSEEREGKKIWIGMISKKILDNIKITEAEYVIRENVDVNTAFALLNLVPSLSVNDVNLLKCLHRGSNGSCFGNEKEIKEALEKEYVNSLARGPVAIAGQDGGFYNNYVREKAKYFITKGVETTLSGGGNDTTDWKRIYKQKKAEYKALQHEIGV